MILFQATPLQATASASALPSASASVSVWLGGPDGKNYAQTVRPEFCSFSAVIPHVPKAADQLTLAAMKWDPYGPTPTAWHVIPSAMADEVNLTGSDFEFSTEKEAVLAHYFCANIMETVGSLVGTLQYGIWEVPVTLNCAQGLHCNLTKEARKLVDPARLPGCKTAMEYLRDKGWWEVARPMDMATDMVDLIQPLLSCELWDWHAASTARMLMKWAGLLSIMAMDRNLDPSWQKK